MSKFKQQREYRKQLRYQKQAIAEQVASLLDREWIIESMLDPNQPESIPRRQGAIRRRLQGEGPPLSHHDMVELRREGERLSKQRAQLQAELRQVQDDLRRLFGESKELKRQSEQPKKELQPWSP